MGRLTFILAANDMYIPLHNAGIREVLFTCTREQSGMASEAVSVDAVPEEVVPLLDRTAICTANDDMGNAIIWYTSIPLVY